MPSLSKNSTARARDLVCPPSSDTQEVFGIPRALPSGADVERTIHASILRAVAKISDVPSSKTLYEKCFGQPVSSRRASKPAMIGNVEPTKEHVLVLRPSFGSLAQVTFAWCDIPAEAWLTQTSLGSPGHRLGTRGTLLTPPLRRQARFFVVANYQSTVWRSQAFAEKSNPATSSPAFARPQTVLFISRAHRPG